MDFQDYQQKARETAIYPSEHSILYPTLGLCGEAGEVAEKVKKVIRDKGGEFDEFDRMNIRKELGDVLWYMAQICSDLDLGWNPSPSPTSRSCGVVGNSPAPVMTGSPLRPYFSASPLVPGAHKAGD